MFLKNCDLSYDKKSSQFQDAVVSAAEYLQNISPSNSYIKIHLNKNPNNIFLINVKIVSTCGVFKCQENGRNIRSLISSLTKNIKQQLQPWRDHRFSLKVKEDIS